jgi:hypothetical protein
VTERARRVAEVATARENTATGKTQGQKTLTARTARGLGLSTLVHIAIVVGLMLVTLRMPEPPASMSLQSSATDSLSETIEISAPLADAEPQTSELDPSQNPTLSNLLGELATETAASEILSDNSALSQALTASTATAAAPRGPSPSEANASFFGVRSGGNSFCYVVDSSGSMRGGAWDAAKAELVRSLRSLKSHQRFFIAFFNNRIDALPSPGSKEVSPYALYATPENIAHAQRWIDTVQVDRGAPPNEALRLAISREPDAIYLLTDGVTKVDVCGFLRKENRTEDFLNGETVRVPIHAIAYYSLEGQELLHRIAQENRGQFIYVPDPRKK